jgi:HSP20 family protein
MLVRTDPFRDLDRLTERLWGTAAHPAVMPMDAWRDGDQFLIEFDLPGISPDQVDLDVERNVLTVRAERPATPRGQEMLAAERPRGVFSRQLVLGDNLDVENVQANYSGGVLTLRIPVAEKAKPRKISVTSGRDGENGGAGDSRSMIIEGEANTDERHAVNA